jgi:LysM repeat protein
MKKKLWLTGVILILLLMAVGLGGCERAKPAPTPTRGGATQVPTSAPGSPTETVPAGTPAGSPQPAATATIGVPAGETVTPAEPQPTTAPPPPSTPAPSQGVQHVVAWGETLDIIAARYGVSAQAIAAANNLSDPNLIRAGDVLIIPGAVEPPSEEGVHIVRQGETLKSIASMYGTTVEAIAQANGIVNENYIWVGQRLIIPGGSTGETGGQVYVVQAGDTLSSIAVKFGTTEWAIAAANNLPNVNMIYVGQTLRIP